MGERHRGNRRPGGAGDIPAGKPLRLAFGLFLLGAAFLAGRFSAPSSIGAPSINVMSLPQTAVSGYLVQDSRQPLDPRELLPLPDRLPGSGGPQTPSGDGECPLYFFHDGQFFQLEPGAPGQPGQPGRFGDIPELFPLEPLPGAPPRRPPEPPPFGQPGLAEAPGLGPLLPISLEGSP
jgi:hypothetical protein